MKHYRVFLRGENFVFEVDGKADCLGFYTTRFVEAEGHEAAEMLAVDLIRRDKTLAGVVKNRRDDPPMIYVEEIEEIERDEVLSNGGYTFFSPDEEADEAGDRERV